jgi:hypothetical protein
MSSKDSFTDFHVDLGGTSVWYHIVHGAKQFIVVKPLTKNMNAYQKWVIGIQDGSIQDNFLQFLQDQTSLKNVKSSTFLVELQEKDTAFIPSVIYILFKRSFLD